MCLKVCPNRVELPYALQDVRVSIRDLCRPHGLADPLELRDYEGGAGFVDDTQVDVWNRMPKHSQDTAVLA
jgi:hypothetical protein